MNWNFEKSDKEFSSDTLALMGQWLTFAAFDTPRCMMGKDLTLREFFNQGIIDDSLGCMFNFHDYFPERRTLFLGSLLNEYGIVGPSNTPSRDYEPKVTYDNVKQTFIQNRTPECQPISPYFAHFVADVTTSETEPFIAELGCEPLLVSLERTGHIKSQRSQYYWTEKIRPLFENIGRWRAKDFVSKEEKLIKTFTQDELSHLDIIVKTQGYRSAINLLRERNDVQKNFMISESHKASPITILGILYPDEDKKLVRMRWYGEPPRSRFSFLPSLKSTRKLFGS